jgi:hypothetical protein
VAYPGILTRGQFATGLQTQSICVNGDYLLVENCDINQTQELDINYYVQGGPAASIYNMGAKKHEGSISFPLRVDKNGNLEPAAQTLLTYAARPMTALRIDTHHTLSHFSATVDNPGSDNNQLLSLDAVVINNLSIKSSDGGPITVSLSVTGMIDAGTGSTFNINENALMGRVLSFAECNVSRKESSMRTTSEFEINIENDLLTPVFLMPYYAGAGVTRKDQIELIAVKTTKWSGSIIEILRQGSDQQTFIHGGFMQFQNLNLEMGSITASFPNPVFKISQVPLTSQTIRRTTSWIGINKPDASMQANGLFTFA